MTLEQAKDRVLDQLRIASQRGPITLDALCDRLGVKRGRGGRYSKRAYVLYALYGRALQVLKREGVAKYYSKVDGGPGWISPPPRV